MLADGLADLTRRADELLLPSKRLPPQDEEVVLEESTELVSAISAANALRTLADRLEREGKDASRIAIRLTAWKRRSE